MKKTKHPRRLPYMLYADSSGHILEDRRYTVAGRSGQAIVSLRPDDFIMMPSGSELFFLPDRKPFGFSVKDGSLHLYDDGQAVSAFASPAHTQSYLSAYMKSENASLLPLYAYTAVGWLDGKFWVCMIRTDSDRRQDFNNFDCDIIEKRTIERLKKYPGNRLIRHLGENCCLSYGCPAARNYFMDRWEAPIPTSPVCNARCLGCISHQPEESGIPPTQHRLNFVPDVEEIVEMAVPHLEIAPKAIVSFGQGCEGEPLMVWELLLEAIRGIRAKTKKGIINLNTNGSKPDALEKLFQAGLDSVRISINSVQPNHYEKYFNPKNYSFADVEESARLSGEFGKWCSVNYFTLPGMTDSDDEIRAFERFIERTGISMVQWRNFNIDPDWYFRELELTGIPAGRGISAMMTSLRQRFPDLYYGYYNPAADIQALRWPKSMK